MKRRSKASIMFERLFFWGGLVGVVFTLGYMTGNYRTPESKAPRIEIPSKKLSIDMTKRQRWLWANYLAKRPS